MMYREREKEQPRRKRGRSRLIPATRRIRLTLSLRPGRDADLLDFFARIPPGQRAQAVKQALRRSGIGYMPGNEQGVRSL